MKKNILLIVFLILQISVSSQFKYVSINIKNGVNIKEIITLVNDSAYRYEYIEDVGSIPRYFVITGKYYITKNTITLKNFVKNKKGFASGKKPKTKNLKLKKHESFLQYNYCIFFKRRFNKKN